MQGTSTGEHVPEGAPEVLQTPLARLDGSVGTLGAIAAEGPTLVVVVERDCPTSRGALEVLAGSGGRVVVLSQGRIEAARALVEEIDAQALDLFVELGPYPVSEALGATTVPTFVLVESGEVEERAEGWDRQTVAALLARVGGDLLDGGPLPDVKPGCQSRHTLDRQTQRRLETEDAGLGGGGDLDELWELGWHDGLPVIPPTRARVREMLHGRDPTTSLGLLGPVGGEVTFERLAACAVLSGCDPSYWPVVEAAARAVCDPTFNAHGLINTTHWASPWIIVNGPVRQRLGMNAGSHVLGSGNRPNATIGRAVRLMMQLTGGGTPGVLDQSTLGGQHKYTACFPEREEVSPWEPWHVTLGHEAETSTVTVMVGAGAAGVRDHTSETVEELALTLGLAVGSAGAPIGSPAFSPAGTETLVVLCPEHARTFGEAGWSKTDVRQAIVDHSGGKYVGVHEITLVVAGGDAGRFSAVMAPWTGYGMGSRPVTRGVDEQ